MPNAKYHMLRQLNFKQVSRFDQFKMLIQPKIMEHHRHALPIFFCSAEFKFFKYVFNDEPLLKYEALPESQLAPTLAEAVKAEVALKDHGN